MANRPGFMDTFRSGWGPTKARGGRLRAPARTAAPRQARQAGPKGRRGTAAPKGAPPGTPTAGGPTKAAPALVKRREELSRNFAELQWDLGGIAYEMARRDHYRLEVLNAQAAKLQEVDAELGQIERMVKLDEAGAAGFCPACGAMQARGASFCWRCGKEVQIGEPASAKASAKPKAKPAAKKAAAKNSGGSSGRKRS
jgi:hypothetical protein